jgi:ATP-dependent exoDNAse (exonuclease V) beta subunit
MLDVLKSLCVFNGIVFLDATHVYLINGRPSAEVSVTGLLNLYKPAFEADKWAEIKAKQRSITSAEIKEEWRINNLYATTRGTILHSYIENYYDNKIIPYNSGDVEEELGTELHQKIRDDIVCLVKQFNKFYNDYQHILPIKKELVVGDIDDTRICGMLDMLAYNTKTNKFELYDYKTNKDISYSSKFEKKFYEPVSHLDVCEFNTYSLQLAIYKYILETYTDIKISGCYVVWFNVDNENYKVIPLLDLQEEVQNILTHYSNKSKVNKEG